MSRPNAFVTMTAGVALVFCLACLSGERFGVSQAHAQPAGTPNPAGTPIPFQCPPPSFSHENTTQHQQTITYVCSESSSTSMTLVPGERLVFDGDGNGQCSGCGDDEDCTCIECPLTRLIVNNTIVFFCNMQQAYSTAYGLDLASESLKGAAPLEIPEARYNRWGHKIPRWAIPVLDEKHNLVGWDFTEIEPEFSVVDGEVVIRAQSAYALVEGDKLILSVNPGEIIGGPEGITLNDK